LIAEDLFGSEIYTQMNAVGMSAYYLDNALCPFLFAFVRGFLDKGNFIIILGMVEFKMEN
jgi:hypothetical protein